MFYISTKIKEHYVYYRIVFSHPRMHKIRVFKHKKLKLKEAKGYESPNLITKTISTSFQ
jgi:hypothetical protein